MPARSMTEGEVVDGIARVLVGLALRPTLSATLDDETVRTVARASVALYRLCGHVLRLRKG